MDKERFYEIYNKEVKHEYEDGFIGDLVEGLCHIRDELDLTVEFLGSDYNIKDQLELLNYIETSKLLYQIYKDCETKE